MNNPSPTLLQEQSAPAVEGVFKALVADIASGKYAANTRLPAERELARQMGASRPTLREALRRMSEWGMVEAKRGSGVLVREMSCWSLEALPAFLIHGRVAEHAVSMGRLITDMLNLRRSLLVEGTAYAVPRVSSEGLADARDLMERAWEARDDPPTFAKLDFAIYRRLFESAGMYPAVWMLNSVGRVYENLAPTLGRAITPQAYYLQSIGGFLDAIEARDAELARERLAAHFGNVDTRLNPMLEMLGK